MTTAIRRTGALIGASLVTFIAMLIGGPALFAQVPPDNGTSIDGTVAVDPTPTQITVHHGSPVWVFVVVALVAIAVTLLAQQLIVRARPFMRRRLQNA